MKLIKLTEKTPESFKKTLLRFITKYDDGHITKKAILWLQNTPLSEIKKENGDIIHIYLNSKNNIIGVIAIANYGLKQAIIVVHPRIRNKGVAQNLAMGTLEDISRFYVKVANDNIASLKLCFSVGMKAFDLIKGPTGKPTLILGFGNWSSEEWFKANK